jgi:hypothetical protein
VTFLLGASIECELYTPENISSSLGVSNDLFGMFASLAGNDFVQISDLVSFHTNELSINKNLTFFLHVIDATTRFETISALCDYLGGKTLESVKQIPNTEFFPDVSEERQEKLYNTLLYSNQRYVLFAKLREKALVSRTFFYFNNK